MARRAGALPLIYWVLLGFLAAYIVVFVSPAFFRGNAMATFQPVPLADHLGIDLKLRLSWSSYWRDPGAQLPDSDGNVFSPLVDLLFAPLLSLRFSSAYRSLALLTIVGYVFLALGAPAWLRGARQLSPEAVLVCATGLVSYALQFEIERGQWNVITMSLVMASILIFHRAPRLRLLAYVLFVLAVQLKFYPIVFVVLLVEDWRDWSSNLKRLGWLLLANAILILIHGARGLQILASGLRDWADNAWIWEGNPSIVSALGLLSDYAEMQGWEWLGTNALGLRWALILVVGLCLAGLLMRAMRRPTAPPDPYYLLAAAIACLLVPAGGYDYRLTILSAPLIYVLVAEDNSPGNGTSMAVVVARRLIIMVLAFFYATTLVSFEQKPYYIANNFVALFVMLFAVSALALTSRSKPNAQAAQPGGAAPPLAE